MPSPWAPAFAGATERGILLCNSGFISYAAAREKYRGVGDDGMATAEAAAFSPQIAARIERLPLSPWHVRIGLIIGSAWFFDGFDALAIAYVLPALIGPWKIAPYEIGLLIASGYAGQTIGSVYFGWLAERIGRVPVALYTLLLFSLTSLVCAFAWDYDSLFVMRFVQGLGLGGEIPIMAAYINEFAASKRRGRFSLSYQILFSIGLFAVALVGRWVVPTFGWRWMFVIGAAPALLALPLRRILPESPRWLASRGRLEEADATLRRIEDVISKQGRRPLPPMPQNVPLPKPADTRFGDLFKGVYRRRTYSVWVLWVSSYLVVYGLYDLDAVAVAHGLSPVAAGGAQLRRDRLDRRHLRQLPQYLADRGDGPQDAVLDRAPAQRHSAPDARRLCRLDGAALGALHRDLRLLPELDPGALAQHL